MGLGIQEWDKRYFEFLALLNKKVPPHFRHFRGVNNTTLR